MYTRAFSTLGCGELDLAGVFTLADAHDVPLVELRALEGRIDLPAYFNENYGDPARFAEQASGWHGRIAALDTSFRLLDGTEVDRAKLREFVPWAEAMGIRWLRVFDGGRGLDTSSVRAAADALEWWQRQRRDEGWNVDLMIETHDVLLDRPKLDQFIAAMPAGSVWLLWDAHHTWRRGGEDPLATWSLIRERVVHVHVKDSVASAPGAAPAYVLPGSGEFPMKPLQAVLAAEFDGVVSLEWERLWHPHLAPLPEVLAAAQARHWW